MFCKELITYQNKLYWIFKRVNKSQIKEDKITDVKEFWCCDVVLKGTNVNDPFLYFLKEIPELDIIE